MDMTRQEFLDNKDALANEAGVVYIKMPEKIRTLLQKIPPPFLEILSSGGKWLDAERAVESWCLASAYRMSPTWGGPLVEWLPETNGDLRDPVTLKALQNPKRIKIKYAPESWKRDFVEAYRCGASWDCYHHTRWARCEPRLEAENAAYYLNPEWSLPPTPKFVDVVPHFGVLDSWRVRPPNGGDYIITGVVGYKDFAGYVYNRGSGVVPWDPAVVERVTIELSFNMVDGHPKLVVPAAVRFRVS